MKTIYLFRHGEVEDAYRERVRGGGTDCSLSEDGERMSIVNAQFLVRADIQLIITSGMKRTDFVGEFLSRRYGIPHRVDTRLREMCLGDWEGMFLRDVNAAYPAEAAEFTKNPLSGVFPGLEDTSQYRNRVSLAWEEVIQSEAERVGVVAHGITNAVILGNIVSPKPYPLKQTIGCMNEIAVEPPPKLVRENVVLYS